MTSKISNRDYYNAALLLFTLIADSTAKIIKHLEAEYQSVYYDGHKSLIMWYKYCNYLAFCTIQDLSGFKNPKGLNRKLVVTLTTARPLKDW